MKRLQAYLFPTLGSLLFILLLAGAYAMGPRMLNIDGDLGRHITIGGYILDRLSVPTSDLFSHTLPGAALTPHEWLAQALFALAERGLGLSGPVALAALCIALAIWLTFRAALARSGSLLAALVCALLGMAASSLHWLPRPHIFTFCLLAVWLAGLERLRKGSAAKIPPMVWMPIAMLLWANLHGAFIAGFAVWLIYLLAYGWDRWIEGEASDYAPGFLRRILITGGLAGLVTLLNPDGLGLWRTSIGYLGSRYLVGHTEEYLPPNFHEAAFWPFLLLVVLGIGLLGLARARRRTVDAALFAAWTAMALYSARNIPLFVLCAVPFLAELGKDLLSSRQALVGLDQFDRRLSAIEAAGRGFVYPVAAALVLVGLAAGGTGRAVNRFDARVFPVAAVDWLAQHPQPGNVFNYFTWGGYLLYRDWPELRVFIDGQTDFYGEGLTREYEQVISVQPGWQNVLTRYQVDWALIPPGGGLADALAREPGWQEIYRDDTAVIFSRQTLP